MDLVARDRRCSPYCDGRSPSLIIRQQTPAADDAIAGFQSSWFLFSRMLNVAASNKALQLTAPYHASQVLVFFRLDADRVPQPKASVMRGV